jgi:hypothetical protein
MLNSEPSGAKPTTMLVEIDSQLPHLKEQHRRRLSEDLVGDYQSWINCLAILPEAAEEL